jgi:calcineurin-like phosphoesterase family protein
MTVAYIHLSDIHFGQERGGAVVVHTDVKDRLVEDIATEVAKLANSKADGVIITGDIAYSGKRSEYDEAARWLDRVASAAKCDITDILVVPGNHDIDRGEISRSAEWMLAEAASKGEAMLDSFLENERDRQVLYARFSSYIPFAEGYNCSLDCAGGLASEKVIELAPGRKLQFVGFNSALICKQKDLPGELLLGARQRVLPIKPGHELVVLCHHPLHWLRDSEDARRFIRSRARVFISGHEHKPGVHLDEVEPGCDLLCLEAGATVPPTAAGPFTYTYNIIEFDCASGADRLQITVHPRAWDDNRKRFAVDPDRLGGKNPIFSLGCPNFKAASAPASEAEPATMNSDSHGNTDAREKEESSVPKGYPQVLLRFFRDLRDGQRLAVLVKLGALPADWSEASTHALERQILDGLIITGRIEELKKAMDDEMRDPVTETKLP